MKTQCTHCNAQFTVANEYEDRKGRCPKCHHVFTIKEATAREPAWARKTALSSALADELEADTYNIEELTKKCPFCGETILEVAKKCKHCSEFVDGSTVPRVTNEPKKGRRSDVRRSELIGGLLLLVPCAAILLIYGWVGQMTLGQNPTSTLGAIGIGMVLLCSILIAYEASQLEIGSDGGWEMGPVGWCIFSLAIWLLAYPIYFNKRAAYGCKNFMILAAIVVVMFAGSMFDMNARIDRTKQALANELHQIEEDTQRRMREIDREVQESLKGFGGSRY